MTDAFDELFRSIRELCPPHVWSKGVEWARQDQVASDGESAGEMTLSIAVGTVAPTVNLRPDDGEWECSCNGDDDPCAHVAAAVIAIRRAREAGNTLPQRKRAGGRVKYTLIKRPEGLAVERTIVDAGTALPLTQPLAGLVAGRIRGPAVIATAEDLEIDLTLGLARDGRAIATPDAVKALASLARLDSLQLNGVDVRINPLPVGIVAVVTNDGPGVKLKGENDPDIREILPNGIALCASGLRAIKLPPLTPAEQEWLQRGRFFGPSELAELASEVLPRLRDKNVPLVIKSDRLPGQSHAEPLVAWTIEPAEHGSVCLIPDLVYGDPPIARVKHGRLESISGKVPTRDTAREALLKDQILKRFGVTFEQPLVMSAAEAALFLERQRHDAAVRHITAFTPNDSYEIHGSLAAIFEPTDVGFSLTFRAAGKVAGSAQVFAAWRAGESLVPLVGGGFAKVPGDWLAKYGDRIRDLLAARLGDAEDDDVKVATAALPMLADLCDEIGKIPPARARELRQRLASFDKLAPFVQPPGLDAELRSYQREGVRWLNGLKALGLGALLADDMGLGKTLQAIAVLSGRTLVVAPTSVLFNWAAEIKRFRPALSVNLYHGPERTWDARADVTLTSYALMRLDSKPLTNERWDTLVFDEAHVLKNQDSLAATTARKIDANFKIALTGTPVENRLEDLHSIMQILNPGVLGDQRYFAERFARKIAAGDEASAALLAARVGPLVLRRLKRDVAPELPPRTDVVLGIALAPDERAQYEAMLLATRRDVVSKLSQGGSVIEALEALLRLRQACCHPALLPGFSAANGAASSRLSALVDELSSVSESGNKALVFSQWTSFLDLIGEALGGAGIPYLRLDGSTLNREAVVSRFQEGAGEPVLIMSLKAGGVGLNLTAADSVYLADPWWNPAAEDQAADRAHRIGQDKPVIVKRLVALGTIEEKILALQAKKRQLAASALSGTTSGEISRDDLLQLLS